MTPPGGQVPVARSFRGRGWALALGLVAVLAGIFAVYRRPPPPAYLTAKIERGALRDEVDATGTVNAVVTVQVGSQVSGTIAKLNADFNSRVARGDVIAEIEPSLLEGALLQATSDLESAKASVSVARAQLEKADAALVQAESEYARSESLLREQLATAQAVEAARAAAAAATASVHAARAGVEQAQADVSRRAASVSVARTNLDHAVIRSPIDGVVVARNVDAGQTVAASLQAPTIFTIAQDLTKMQVYAKVVESDVGRIRKGGSVSFKVDAFPKEPFTGVVSEVRMNATTVQNVVTYDAIIDFANPDLKLFPGMTAYVTIPVATATDVLKLPNAALRFKPSFAPEEPASRRAAVAIDSAKGSGRDVAPGSDAEAVVWRRSSSSSLEPVLVSLGITDHAFTEVKAVLSGALKEGDEVVTGSAEKASASAGAPLRR